MKTKTTRKLEVLLENHFNMDKDWYAFECTLGANGNDIVDCIMYDGEFHCYEIKQSVADFRSKNKLSFVGHKNYFVMPYELYLKVRNEIDKDIGVYCPKAIPTARIRENIYDVYEMLECVKYAKFRELRADSYTLLNCILRSLFRNGWVRKRSPITCPEEHKELEEALHKWHESWRD